MTYSNKMSTFTPDVVFSRFQAVKLSLIDTSYLFKIVRLGKGEKKLQQVDGGR